MNKKLVLAVAVLFVSVATFAQEFNGNWSFGVGVSAIDVYPVGEDAPQGDYFDEFFNVNDHWNLGLYVDVSKQLSKNFTFTGRASYAQLSKWGQVDGVPSIPVNNLEYIGLDGLMSYNFFTEKVVKPFVGVGGGYTWIEEGPFNTFSANNGVKNYVGAGTLNGALGINFGLSDNVNLKVQTLYKHAFEDYLTSQFQHSVGLSYTFGKVAKKLVDTDNDGVADENDLCPDVAGLPEYAGCPDTDGDGTPDTLDKCPNEKGTDNGCPSKDAVNSSELETAQANLVSAQQIASNLEASIVKEISAAVYFDLESSELSINAKQVLDVVIQSFKAKENLSILVNGFADSKGSETFNNKLSAERAKAVQDYLVAKGVVASAIKTNNFGETNPVTSNDTKEGRALNRRAELKVSIK